LSKANATARARPHVGRKVLKSRRLAESARTGCWGNLPGTPLTGAAGNWRTCQRRWRATGRGLPCRVGSLR